MNYRNCILLGLLLVASEPGLAADTPRTNTPAKQEFSSFRLITERNIFNPRRYARRDARERRPAARIESFALVGTMSYEKGPFAFFEGSRSDYRKAVKPDDSIAGYAIKEIASSYVKLANGTNEIKLPVGMQMRREEEGEWQVSAIAEAPAPSTSSYAAARPSVSTTIAQVTSNASTNVNTDPEVIVLDGGSQGMVSGSAPDGTNTNAPADSASSGTTDPVLLRLMQRAAAERGESR